MGGTAVKQGRGRTAAPDDFALAYRSALGSLVGYFRGKGLGSDDARDLAHETVVRTLVHLKRHGRTQPDLGPLTKTIARNLLVERLRKQTPSTVPLSDAVEVADDAPEPLDHALATERREAVQLALRSLSPRHRRVVELWMQGRNPGEIARELGIKRNAADAILHRARRALASRLGPRALWGLLGVAWFRARASVRDAAQTAASFSPSSAAALPAGVSLATVGLAAVLSVTTPATQATADSPAAAPVRSIVADTPRASIKASGKSPAAAVTGSTRDVDVPQAPRYTFTAEADVPNPATGEDDKRGVDLWYDPEANGRGVLDDVVFEPLVKVGCATCDGDDR